MSEVATTETAQDNTKAATASTVLTDDKAIASTDDSKSSTTETTAAAQVVPEKYDLKLPENSPLSPKHLEALAEYAKAQKLTNEAAQALLEREHSAVASYVQNQQQELAKKPEAWLADSKADREIGGESFGKNAELAKRVLAKFGSDDFKKVLNETGLGNHKELLRVFVRIGNAMSEDTLVLPGATAGGQKSDVDVFYPQAATE